MLRSPGSGYSIRFSLSHQSHKVAPNFGACKEKRKIARSSWTSHNHLDFHWTGTTQYNSSNLPSTSANKIADETNGGKHVSIVSSFSKGFAQNIIVSV